MKLLNAGGFLKAAGELILAIDENRFDLAIAMIDELSPRQAFCLMSAIIEFEPDNMLAFSEFIGEHMNGDSPPQS